MPHLGLAVMTGASSAISAAVAAALGELGYDLALLGRDETRLAAARGACSPHVRSAAYAVDLTDAAATERGVTRLRTEQGEPPGAPAVDAAWRRSAPG